MTVFTKECGMALPKIELSTNIFFSLGGLGIFLAGRCTYVHSLESIYYIVGPGYRASDI